MKTPEKSVEDEKLVEQLFQYYDDIDCAETVDQRINAKEQAELWIRRIIQTERNKRDDAVERKVLSVTDRLKATLGIVEILKLKADDYNWQCHVPDETKHLLEQQLKELKAITHPNNHN